MIDSLITSQTRIKLLLKFFLNSKTQSHLRGLESEFGESTNGIRIELNRLENANLLRSHKEGNKKLYSANRSHPLFDDIHNIIIKQTGIDRVVENVVDRIGNLKGVYLVGDLARGINSHIIDLVLIGDNIDKEYLDRKVKQCETLVGRRIIYHLFSVLEANAYLMDIKPSDLLLLWNKEGNNLLANDKPNNTEVSL